MIAPPPMISAPAATPSAAALATTTPNEEPARRDRQVAQWSARSTCSPPPGAKRFVQAGEQVTAGQTLLIIEAMKTMNPVPAPKDGKVTKVLVEDGQPVEFGEPLVVIE